MACPVDSLLFESGFLFVGMHAPGQGAPLTWPGCIKVWNTTTNAHHQLEGFQASPRCTGVQMCRQPVGRAEGMLAGQRCSAHQPASILLCGAASPQSPHVSRSCSNTAAVV